MKLKNDFQLDIATGHSRLSKKWKNKQWAWSELVTRCSETKRTGESVKEYQRMSREEQTDIKDIGGFVGGYLSGSRRKGENVLYRTIATLDIDYGTADVWEDFTMAYSFAAMLYSTHKHTPEKPRYRLVIPFNREVKPNEYEPICRKIAETTGIDLFDITTYQLPRLFYWPSTSKDGEFIFEVQDGKACNVDEILNTYHDYNDISEWPVSDREGDVIAHEVRKAGDPLEKPGLIGAFCRAYTIEEAIEKFLPEAYERTATEGRYTYKLGSVAGGLVCYSGKFAYSHHETDPASRQLCNAFDLCRIHLFGLQDEGAETKDITRLPSYLKMQDFAAADKGVKSLMAKERRERANNDFADLDLSDTADSTDWQNAFEYDRKGAIKETIENRKLIAANDPHFRAVKYDVFAQRDIIDIEADPDSPFTGTHGADVDDTALTRMAGYVETTYQLKTSVSALTDKMLLPTAPERGFNPVLEFIESEQWDNTPRIESVLIRYLGAEDTPLIRTITRKWFVAAISRAYNPGCKFDYCLVLQGAQGIGKSTVPEVLAGKWLGSLSLSASDKEQCEVLTESWIVEIPELKGMRRAEADRVKDLISRQTDDFRAAYARKRTKNARHCVFIASTNDNNFLKDTTGNRRFWIVEVKGNGHVYNWKPQLIAEVPQLWAEALYYYREQEQTYLTGEHEKQMEAIRERFTDTANDPLREYLQKWLDIKLPVDWANWGCANKRAFYNNRQPSDPTEQEGIIRRDTITICEILNECPYRGLNSTKYTPATIGAILKSLDWEYVDKPRRLPGYKREGKSGNILSRYYQRPITDIENEDDNEPI